MRTLLLFSLPLLVVALLAPPALAQTDVVYAFGLDVVSVPDAVVAGEPAHAQLLFKDLSRDDAATTVPNGPGYSPLAHNVAWSITPLANDTKGWIYYTPSSLVSYGGSTTPVTFTVLPDFTIVNPYFQARVTATITGTQDGQTRQVQAIVAFFTRGVAGFAVNPAGQVHLEPRSIGTAHLELINQATVPRGFTFAVKQNECGLGVAPPPPVVVRAKQSVQIPITLSGPEETNIIAKTCLISFAVASNDNPDNPLDASVIAQISGVYIDPMGTFWALAAILALILLVLFLKRRKERLEEELLGKPQKPWTIPVERVYLKHLKQKDERAWYMVRHFLMEEEYRSALLWHQSYKKATKGSRKKERLILKEEKSYDRWTAAWRRDIAKPGKKADRFEAKLQRKLDRKARKIHRKAVARWTGLSAKLRETHDKRLKAAEEAHLKAVRKADKKGLPAPPPPILDAPDIPDEPAETPILLAEHRWSKKAARFRRRKLKRAGNLEVRFERADARRLRKLERKVRKIARKLEDPSFIGEHPLLKRAMAAKA